MKRFGEKLRQLRLHNHITLKQLASYLGYSTHSYLSEIESGNKLPTVMLALEIARLFQCTTDELLKDEVEVQLKQVTWKDGHDAALR